MLYECWSEIVRERSGENALRHPDLPEGWTFGDLDRRARKVTLPASEFAIAYGDSLDYFPTILAAWKNNLPVLILESIHLLLITLYCHMNYSIKKYKSIERMVFLSLILKL